MRILKADEHNAVALLGHLNDRKQAKIDPPILFLGAGTSISSGIPRASELIALISQSRHTHYEDLNEVETSLGKRHAFLEIRPYLVGKTPSFGYRLLAQLIQLGYFDYIFTTNWDLLLEQALQKHVGLDHVRSHSFPEMSTKEILNILNNDHVSPVIAKLHGDISSVLTLSSKDLLSFEDSVVSSLKNLVSRRGMIIVGYGMRELRISTIVDPRVSDKIWYVAPSLDEERTTSLSQLNIRAENIIVGEVGDFDNFMESMTSGLLKEVLADRIMLDGKKGFLESSRTIIPLVDKIRHGLDAEILTIEEIENETRKILAQLRRIARNNTRTCLVFINDPSAPGGMSVYNLIMRTESLRNQVKDHQIAIARIEGRVGTSTRTVIDISSDQEIEWKNIDMIVLVDESSFTASTLLLVKAYLETTFNVEPDKFFAAVIKYGNSAKKNLDDKSIITIAGEETTAQRIVTPWGATRPTSPPPMPLPPKLSLGATFSSELFLISNSLWYNPKPWGDITEFSHNSLQSTRLLSFDRFQRASLHFHFLRDEIFIGIDDDFILQLWDQYIKLGKHQTVRVPAGVPHRLIAMDTSFQVFEIALGEYEEFKDIYRIEDMYGRTLG